MLSKSTSNDQPSAAGQGEIIKMGHLKKLKTMKKKFFILRAESTNAPARLEYYDAEKKWRNNQPPKKTINLKTCFNINRRRDTKYKHVIALYRRDDCFCLVLDCEEDLEQWLKSLLQQQCGEDCVDGEVPKPFYEHVWKVAVQDKGLGDSQNLIGAYHVCLTDKSLSLVKASNSSDDEPLQTIDFPLMFIRSCGVTTCFFYIEVGRQTVTGAGELWMLTEDANIAHNMNSVIYNAFTSQQKDNKKDSEQYRKRSASATESSKPTLQRRPIHTGNKQLYSEDGGSSIVSTYRASVPEAEPENSHAVPVSTCLPRHYTPRPPSQRRHSVSAMSSSSVQSTLTLDKPNTESLLITHQRTKSCPVTDSTAIPSTSHLDTDRRGTRRNLSAARSTTGRDRSDSMPSRARTTSETVYSQYTNRMNFGNRPHSIHGRGNHSSPGSGQCSTDSAGSSLSIDEGDVVDMATSPRTHGHSTTPDEPAILEENCDDYLHWSNSTGDEYSYNPDDYVPLQPCKPLGRKISESLYCGKQYSIDNRNNNLSNNSGEFIKPTSANHSRGSSLAEETPDGYVPMMPGHTDDGYVDMDPQPAHPWPTNDDYQNSDMSPASSCSITSGTPSTDIRFSDFPLEKVSSYFPPSEEDEERPHRAYSVGSKPESFKKKPKNVQNEAGEACRSRALSLGSRVQKWGTRALIQEAHRFASRGGHVPQGTKSSSAPILSSSCPGSSRQPVVDPMGDLMEIDYTQNKKKTKVKGINTDSSSQRNLDITDTLSKAATSSSDSGYVAMSPSNLYSISKSQNIELKHSSETMATSPPPHILSVSPRSQSINASFSKSPPKPFVSLFGRSPPRDKSKSLFSPPSNSNYMDMSRSDSKNRVIISSSTLRTIGEKGDIKPQKFPTTSSANLNITPLPNKPFTPDDQNYMDMTLKSTKKMTRAKSDKDMKYNRTLSNSPNKKAPEGYMDMSWGASAAKLTRKSSETKIKQDDYISMVPSQPIAITSSNYDTTGRKASSVTPPKAPPSFLPIGNGPSPITSPFSSIRRNQKRRNSRKKQERRESKENVTTTPTGSNSAIFPLCLNSPSADENSTPTNSPSAEADSPLEDCFPEEETTSERRGGRWAGRKEHDYMEIDEFATNLSVPLSQVLRISSKDNSPCETPTINESSDFGDYAVMRPVGYSHERKTSAPVLSIKRFQAISEHAASTSAVPLNITANTENMFAHKNSTTTTVQSSDVSGSAKLPVVRRLSSPIPLAKKPVAKSSPFNEKDSQSSSRKADDHGSVSRQISTSSTSSTHSGVCRQVSSSSSSSTEVASVKDESTATDASTQLHTLTTGASRPSSVSSERDITYASLDLAPSGSEGEDGARSPRTLRTHPSITESSGSSPSPNPTGGETFTYAEIDFVKSESLRQSHIKKLRH